MNLEILISKPSLELVGHTLSNKLNAMAKVLSHKSFSKVDFNLILIEEHFFLRCIALGLNQYKTQDQVGLSLLGHTESRSLK